MSPGAWLTGGDWGAYEDSNPANSTGAAAGTAPAHTLLSRPHDHRFGERHTPVLLNRWDRSAWLANGVALRARGTRPARQPVAGLECVNGQRNRPRRRRGARARARGDRRPRRSTSGCAKRARRMQHLAELGVTTIHDITPPVQLPVYTELKRRGELTVRVFARPTLDKWRRADVRRHLATASATTGFASARSRDSSTASRATRPRASTSRSCTRASAASGATAPTPRPPTVRARAWSRPATWSDCCSALDSAGWWANVHAIGDDAIDTRAHHHGEGDAHERPEGAALAHHPLAGHPQRRGRAALQAARASSPRCSRITRSTTCGGWRSASATRARWAYAFKTFHDAGVPLLFGSDWPGTNASWYTANPMTILYAAVTRQTLDGKPEGGWFPRAAARSRDEPAQLHGEQRVGGGRGGEQGRSPPGKLADFVIIDRDLFAIPPDEIKDARADDHRRRKGRSRAAAVASSCPQTLSGN